MDKTEKARAPKEKAFTNINVKSFVMVVALLMVVLFLAGALSYIVPQGSFERDTVTEEIIPDSYETNGEIKGIALWRVITAPVRVLWSDDAITIIMISVFLLVMSGVFNIIEKTNGIKVFISRLMNKLKSKGGPVICIATLIFMAFGSFFGMFEELVTLVPIVVVFTLSMGMDTMTGLGVSMLAACFGFSAAITNPFSVGLASEELGVPMLDGAIVRVIFFGIVYFVLCVFLMMHLKKIEKNPEASPTYKTDIAKREELLASTESACENSDKIFKVYLVFFSVQVVVLVLIASIRAISSLAVPILALSFLITGIISGLLVTERRLDVFKYLFRGAVAMLPAVLMIMIASSVSLVLAEGGVLDTILNFLIGALKDKGKFFCVVLIYILILFLQVFIPSASAKIRLVMPIIAPVCTQLGISPAVVILAYCMADGFTDMILPTNPVLLVGLSMGNTNYGKWVKWTWKLQLTVFAITIGVLYLATLIL